MRLAIAIVIAVLVLSRGYGPALAQTHQDASPALSLIRMIDARTGWAVTDQPDANALLRTSDGGMNWINVTPLNSSSQRISVDNAAVLSSLVAWVASSDTAAGSPSGTTRIFHTVDGGQTWGHVPVPVLSAISMHFIDPLDGWLLTQEADGSGMGREAASIYRSDDGGVTWTKVAGTSAHDNSSGLPLAGAKMAIAFRDATTGWITGGGIVNDQLHLYVTHERGRTWREQKIPLPPQVTSPWQDHPTPPKFFTKQDGILAAEYDYGETQSPRSFISIVVFYVTRNGGTTWTYTTPVPARLTSWDSPPSFIDINHGWTTDGHILYATRDGGRHWMKFLPTGPFSEVKQLEFISPQVGWALRETSPFLLKTLDAGHLWVPVAYTISRP